MKKKQRKTNGSNIWLNDAMLSATRMQAIQVAANLPEPQPGNNGIGGYAGSPGKSADKVIADADKIIAFVTKR